jgi:hypothetical protein
VKLEAVVRFTHLLAVACQDFRSADRKLSQHESEVHDHGTMLQGLNG